MDCDRYSGDAFFHRLQQFSYRPDIILASEVPFCTRSNCGDSACFEDDSILGSSRSFLTMLNAVAPGVEYDLIHAEGPPRYREPADVLIAFRTDRFSYEEDDVHTWQELDGDGCLGPEQWPPGESFGGQWMLAVRFWDAWQSRHVVAASVHFNHRTDCVEENLRRFQAQVDDTWDPLEGQSRDMIIIGGDFNERPCGSLSEDRCRAEPSADPWYQAMSEAYGGDLHYHDTVWTRNHVPSLGRNNPICTQWTRTNAIRFDEAAVDQCDYDCEDDGQFPTEPECKPHKRVDYLWVRWESPDGTVLSADNTPGFDASAWIPNARADQGYFGSIIKSPGTGLYSDHRAVHAVLRWW